MKCCFRVSAEEVPNIRTVLGEKHTYQSCLVLVPCNDRFVSFHVQSNRLSPVLLFWRLQVRSKSQHSYLGSQTPHFEQNEVRERERCLICGVGAKGPCGSSRVLKSFPLFFSFLFFSGFSSFVLLQISASNAFSGVNRKLLEPSVVTRCQHKQDANPQRTQPKMFALRKGWPQPF